MNNQIDKYRTRNVGAGQRTAPLRNIKTFSSFKNPVYRLYFVAMFGWMASMNMQQMTRSLLLYRMTHSAAILASMSLANAVPMLLLSLFGGVIADQMQKKKILLVGMISSAVVSGGIASTLTIGFLSPEHPESWWVLMVCAALQGAVQGLTLPSRSAILPEIVGTEQIMNAVSLSQIEQNSLRLLAPALTGFLIEAFDFEAVYYTMTALYIIAAAFITFIPPTSSTTAKSGKGPLADIKEGLNYIWHHSTIVLILAFILGVVVLSMPYQTLLPVFTEDILNVGAKGLGVLMSVSGVGAIVGSLVLASLPNKKRGLLLLVSAFLLSVALTGFAFSRSWFLSLALIIFVGLGQTGRMALGNTLLQYYTEDEYRGRVMSFYMWEFGLSSLGTFGAGMLAEAIGVQRAVGGFAAVLILVSVPALTFVPRLRRLN